MRRIVFAVGLAGAFLTGSFMSVLADQPRCETLTGSLMSLHGWMTVAEHDTMSTRPVHVCFTRDLGEASVLNVRVVTKEGVSMHMLTPASEDELEEPGCMRFLKPLRVDLHAAGHVEYRVRAC